MPPGRKVKTPTKAATGIIVTAAKMGTESPKDSKDIKSMIPSNIQIIIEIEKTTKKMFQSLYFNVL